MRTFEERSLNRINKAFFAGIGLGVGLGAMLSCAVVIGMLLWMR